MGDASGRVRIVCGGLDTEFLGRLRRLSGSNKTKYVILASDAESAHALELQIAAHHPRVVLVHGTWLRKHGLDWLGKFRESGCEPQTIAIAPELRPATLAYAIPLGLRGFVEPDATGSTIAKAIDTVCSGELWLSRRRILTVMRILTGGDRSQSTGIWSNLPSLTEREHGVLLEAMEGGSNKEIAGVLDISEQTVKIHLQHIYRKLGVHRRADLLLSRI
jgi:two-component system nitrate/nitrite response regulator NarL